MSQKFRKKFGEKKEGKISITKKSAEKNPKNLGGKSQNPEKNCRDFLIPKIFVRFFQSNLPLVLLCSGREDMPLLLDDLDMTGYAFTPVTGQGAG
jgi:hypothetical protein